MLPLSQVLAGLRGMSTTSYLATFVLRAVAFVAMTLLAILVLLDSAAPVTVVGPIANDPVRPRVMASCRFYY